MGKVRYSEDRILKGIEREISKMKVMLANTIELDTAHRVTIDSVVGDNLELLVSTGSAEYTVYLKPHELVNLLDKGYFQYKEYTE
jgi:2-polyprenyl-3-methyl-5-hydroxy-6-metoxy-1,4-benzoquinol methylase